jgi:hypothetical protein
MKPPRLNAIIATLMMPMTAFGITTADMKFLKAKPIPTRSKATTLSCATTWPVWPDRRVVSRVAPLRSSVPCACLSIVTTVASCTSIVSQPIQLMSWNSLPHEFIHSLDSRRPFKLKPLTRRIPQRIRTSQILGYNQITDPPRPRSMI